MCGRGGGGGWRLVTLCTPVQCWPRYWPASRVMRSLLVGLEQWPAAQGTLVCVREVWHPEMKGLHPCVTCISYQLSCVCVCVRVCMRVCTCCACVNICALCADDTFSQSHSSLWLLSGHILEPLLHPTYIHVRTHAHTQYTQCLVISNILKCHVLSVHVCVCTPVPSAVLLY